MRLPFRIISQFLLGGAGVLGDLFLFEVYELDAHAFGVVRLLLLLVVDIAHASKLLDLVWAIHLVLQVAFEAAQSLVEGLGGILTVIVFV